MDPHLRRVPTSYYGRQSGAGLTLEGLYPRGPVRVGVLGLGVGTVATYGRPGDYYRFYELVPGVVDMARADFHYLELCEADCDVVVGDGRLVMASEPPQNFDVLLMDAFSSDSVPSHLLTREAFDVYLRHLKPDGVLCINVSNRHLDLRPVAQANAEHLGMTYTFWASLGSDRTGTTDAWWFVTSPSRRFVAEFETSVRRLTAEYQSDGTLATFGGRFGTAIPPADLSRFRPWTDDYCNLLQVLR
jgi:spermidine synthase